MCYFVEEELSRLDSIIQEIENNAENADTLIRSLAEHSTKITGDLSTILATDPYSNDYIKLVCSLHEELIGKKHSPSLEGLPVLNPDYERDWPYPWGTKSPGQVSKFLIAYGLLIKYMNLTPNARILEVGCGLGSLTKNLARMGYRVDAIDPNELQCSIVRDATKDFPTVPHVIAVTLDQWLENKSNEYKYDAVIFFESFHHILNHQACIKNLLLNHMEQDAKIVLAAEPIFESQCDVLPYPWGIRLDGESIRVMRRWGWIELGFTKKYIDTFFNQFGLSLEWVKCDEGLPLSQIIIGYNLNNSVNQSNDSGIRYPASFLEDINFSLEGFPNFIVKFEGLSEPEPLGRRSIGKNIRICFDRKLPRNFTIKLNLSDVFGPNVGKILKINAGPHQSTTHLKPIELQKTYSFDFNNVDTNELEIIIPHPCRPKDIVELGIEDPRKFGVAIASLLIQQHK